MKFDWLGYLFFRFLENKYPNQLWLEAIQRADRCLQGEFMPENNKGVNEIATAELAEALELYHNARRTGSGHAEARLEVSHSLGGIPEGFDQVIRMIARTSFSYSAARSVTR